MCGIAGVFGVSAEDDVRSMCHLLNHRGPHASTLVSGANWSLGGVHLHIIQEGTANLLTPQKKDAIAFNGEVYNFRELGQSLGKTLSTDTDLIALLAQRHPEHWVDQLEGMFAIALCVGDELTLIRDRFGIKPLFYTELANGCVYFASELKALLQVAPLSLELDEDALSETAAWGYISTPYATMFRGIRQIPPGHCFQIRKGEQSICWPFVAEPTQEMRGGTNIEAAASDIRSGLVEAMQRQMCHDPSSKIFFLSGGLDSSTLVAAATSCGQPLHTVTLLGPANAEDGKWAKNTASAFRTSHHEVACTSDTFWDALGPYIFSVELLELPGVFDAFGGLAFYILCRFAGSCGYRVAFVGEAADELFGGYYWPYTHPLGFVDKLRASAGENSKQHEFLNSYFPAPENREQYRESVFRWMLGAGLSNYHLWCVDRCSMAFSLEARPPFLDERIANCALRLPIKCLCNQDETKIVLKKAVSEWFSSRGISGILKRQKLAMPSAARDFAKDFTIFSHEVYPPERMRHHPFRSVCRDSAGAYLLFDLYFWIHCERRSLPLLQDEWIETLRRMRIDRESPLHW